jgi:hypothetical protein
MTDCPLGSHYVVDSALLKTICQWIKVKCGMTTLFHKRNTIKAEIERLQSARCPLKYAAPSLPYHARMRDVQFNEDLIHIMLLKTKRNAARKASCQPRNSIQTNCRGLRTDATTCHDCCRIYFKLYLLVACRQCTWRPSWGGGGMTRVASLKFQRAEKNFLEILYSVMQRPRSRGCVMNLGGWTPLLVETVPLCQHQ